jgi:ATP-dependent DNA helicase RecQ
MLEHEGIPATYYHAGLTGEERTARQELWIDNRIRVMACTNAFGMGIDKPDVRVVIHYDATDSLEAYYQEAGRAGRDEQKAYAVLLYQQQELNDMVKTMILQFPEIAAIREVYQCLVNYLQVPVGSAEGIYYDFDINDFVRRFNLNITTAYSALRILEQEGILQLSESVFMPSRVEFVISKRTLYDFTEMQPAFEPVTQTLLRTYEGIFDTPVPVYEKQLARLLRKPETEVIQWLQQLHQRGIIKYSQRKEEPQLCFSQERISAQHLRIDAGKIKERMQAYKLRLDAMLEYVENEDMCRTQLLVRYFGEKNAVPCGTCDVCIANRKKPLEGREGSTIAAQLLEQLGNEPQDWPVVRNRLPLIDEDILLEVMQYLISEEKAGRDADGKVFLK